MNKIIKKGQDTAEPIFPDDSMPPDDSMSPEPPTTRTAEESEEFGKLLEVSLNLVSKGIEKGVRADMAKETSGGWAGDILSFVPNLISSVLTGHIPFEPKNEGERLLPTTRGLEDKVKTEAFWEVTKDANKKAKKSFQTEAILVGRNIYNSNFEDFISLLKSASDLFEDLKPNLTTNLEVLGAQYKGADENTRISSDESPYRIIIFQLIPTLRQKFEAIESFKIIIGPGSDIDSTGISARFVAGEQTDADIKQLEGLYKAIEEWHKAIRGFGISSLNQALTSKKEESRPEEGPSSPRSTIPFARVFDNIGILEIRPDPPLVIMDPHGYGVVMFEARRMHPTDEPVINLVLHGDMVGEVNSAGTGMEFLEAFIRSNKITFPAFGSDRLATFIRGVTVETNAGTGGLPGAELSIRFIPVAIQNVLPPGDDNVELMRVVAARGTRTVTADDKSLLDGLVKISSATSTTPYYETVSPSGERVSFTPSDLVIGGGKLKDSKGKGFKVKKRKGKSLADRVMSPGFGRAKRKS